MSRLVKRVYAPGIRRNVNSLPAAENLARITMEPGKHSGQPCIRGLRITVKDVLEYLAGGMTHEEILEEFPELEREDFQAVYACAAQSLLKKAS